MRIFLFILALCIIVGIVFFANTKAPKNVNAVWVENTPPPANLPTAAGFSVSPDQAYSIIKDAKLLSLKHIWHIYADTQYYYVHDTFLGGGARKAYTNGVRVDGKTGYIVQR